MDWDGPERLYPPIDSPLSGRIPDSISHAFEEAQTCFRNRAFTAAVLMCRRAIESVAFEHMEESGPLATRLAQLRERGVIDHQLYEWADALRIVGNEAAHELTRPVSAEDASDVINFTRALVEYTFTYRDQFAEFKKRRERPERE